MRNALEIMIESKVHNPEAISCLMLDSSSFLVVISETGLQGLKAGSIDPSHFSPKGWSH
jgi:hypothetical protein